MSLIEVGGMPDADKGVYQNIATREHIDYQVRKKQMGINELGFYGGRPYVDARLSRFTGESDIDWNGGVRDGDGTKITGRKEQSYVTNHLERISSKINQYVFSVEPEREGVNEDFENKTSSDGMSINSFMQEISSQVTVNKWCWIGIDTPESNQNMGQLSIAQKEALMIRPYWKMYTALQIPDWHIDPNGDLQWLITEGSEYIASDPLKQAQVLKVRRLWTKEGITKIIFDPKDLAKVKWVEKIDLPMGEIPFVLVNKISPFPYAFDNLESINRTLMDLSSVNRANYFKMCFPQLYLPSSVLDSVMNAYGINADSATKKLMGWNYPILVGPDDQVPGYIMPDANAIGVMREEIDSLKEELFENVGLLLRKSTKQAESAEAKQWDNIDLQAVMKQRAVILEEAEIKAVALSKKIDSGFSDYKPEYNKQFTVSNFESDVETTIKGKTVGAVGVKEVVKEVVEE